MKMKRFRMLEVDLTNEKTKAVDVTEDIKKHLGGRGLASKLLWDRVPKDADPLGPDNILHFGIGPITSLVGTKVAISFKSPLTGRRGRACMSGAFGRELLYAGYVGGILLTGRAESPSYLYVKDGEVELRDAAPLWGMKTLATQYELKRILREETQDQDFAVSSVGPAGENMVRWANISNEYYHSASKFGGGAVMGSKNLKAVAVRGTKGPDYVDNERVWKLYRRYQTHPAIIEHKYKERRFGHSTSMPVHYHAGGEGVKNNQLGWHDVCMKSNPHIHEMRFKVWTDGCPGCSTPCFVPYYMQDPQWGSMIGEMRHDNAGAFNANILAEEGYLDCLPINVMCEELGLDAEEGGGLVAWAMELYEKGIVTKEDLGGIELTWGNIRAVCELLEKIAYREDLGDVLADGFKGAIPAIGKGCDEYAFMVHWCACATYDLRRYPERSLMYGTSNTGARMGTGLRNQLTESATMCNFTANPIPRVFGSHENCAAEYLKAACGWDMSVDEIKEIELRNYVLERCFSMREGYRPLRDDEMPHRAFSQPITNKYGEAYVLDRKWWEEAIREYYVKEFDLTEEGLPSHELLEKLGLGYVAPSLEPMGLIG